MFGLYLFSLIFLITLLFLFIIFIDDIQYGILCFLFIITINLVIIVASGIYFASWVSCGIERSRIIVNENVKISDEEDKK